MMNPALKDMLEAYRPETPVDYQNAAREIVQEIALLGLWRGGFFEHAAFYGGTITRNVLVDLLRERFATIDFKQAADEVRVFLSDPRELQLWSREFFDGLAPRGSSFLRQRSSQLPSGKSRCPLQ